LLTGVVAGGALLAWSWRRPKPARLPLVMLASIGVAVVGDFASLVGSGDLEVGAWILTAGYLLAVVAAVTGSRAAGPAGR
jgi:hypothetical protein